MNTNSIIDILTSQVPNLQAIYLFGSFDSPYFTSESDIDIAIIAESSLSSNFRWQLMQEIAYTLRKDVDLIDLKGASTVLRFEIISHGKRIFCLDPKWCDLYETLVYSAYVRFNDERRDLLNDISERGGQILHG